MIKRSGPEEPGGHFTIVAVDRQTRYTTSW
jgi:hypothetical protein